MKTLIENLELALTFAGLLVIFGIALVLGVHDKACLQVIAVTATGVGVLHGLVFWIVRRRQRDVRRKTLAEAQQMLKDVINNQLAVIQMTRETPHDDHHAMATANQRIVQAIQLISDTLHTISEESLQRWRSKYGQRVGEES